MSRVAFISVSAHMVRATLPPLSPMSLIWNGVPARHGEITTHSGGRPFHERTDGLCRWSTLWLPSRDLVNAGNAARGDAFVLPTGERRWRPRRDALQCLIELHETAIRATTTRPKLPVEKEAAHGLVQQLTLALANCLTGDITENDVTTPGHYANIMARLEDTLQASHLETISVAGIAAVLGISTTVLQACCHAHLGTTPSQYLYLRRMREVRRALRTANLDVASVARIAGLHGFLLTDRFTSDYSALFGESPTATLRWTRFR